MARPKKKAKATRKSVAKSKKATASKKPTVFTIPLVNPQKIKHAKKPGASYFVMPETLNEAHKKHLRDFATILLGVDVAVKRHARLLGVEEEILKREEQRLERDFLLKPDDKKELKAIFENFIENSAKLIELEKLIYEDLRPLVDDARKRSRDMPMALLRFLEKIHAGFYRNQVMRLEMRVPKIREIVMSSLAKEKEEFYEEYPQLLGAFENNVKRLMDLEVQWHESNAEQRHRLFKMHYNLRKFLHNEVYRISKDIYDLYELRLRIYDWLIGIDSLLEPRIVSTLEEEYDQIEEIQVDYSKMYKEHAVKFDEIYNLGEGR